MRFTKLHSAGNDFVLVEAEDDGRDWSSLAAAMCRRHFGVGADGLLLLLSSDSADLRMRMFNPDGPEAETCGNGLVCLVGYAVSEGLLHTQGVNEVTVETAVGVSKARISDDEGIQVGMGTPKFGVDDIPIDRGKGKDIVDIKSMLSYPINVEFRELILNLVSMGNPHAVHFDKRPVADFPLHQLGPMVENLPAFPRRINFEVARVIDRGNIEARVWERGAGKTLACGSGACAIAVAAHKLGYINNKVDIELPGGTLGVEWDGAGEVYLNSLAEIVFHGEWLQGV